MRTTSKLIVQGLEGSCKGFGFRPGDVGCWDCLSWVICTRKIFDGWVRAVIRNVVIKTHGKERLLIPRVRWWYS